MQYPLSSADRLIHETIHPSLLLNDPGLQSSQQDTWEQAHHQVKELRLLIMNQLINAKGIDALRVTVHACQAGFTSLINQLSRYIVLTEQMTSKKKTSQFLQEQYRNLQEVFISHLSYLQTYFSSFFDLQQQVPSPVWLQKQALWLLQLGSLKEEWLYKKCDPYLSVLVFTTIENRIQKEPYPCYLQLNCLQRLLTDLQTDAAAASPSLATSQFISLLIRNNFNHPEIAAYYLQELRQQIPEEAGIEEKTACIALQLKHCEQLYCSEDKWFLQYPALPDTICKAVKQELLFCYRSLKLNALQANQTVPASSSPHNPLLVRTALSVGQLAVMIRLLVDCGIIESANQSELLKRIAGAMATTKTATISAESLRVKYYAPDKAAIAITRDYLLTMLGALKKL